MRWHVRHAEAYLRAFPGGRLVQHTREQVYGYLEHAGELDRMADAQFVQIVDAIQNLLVAGRAPIAAEVDWGCCRASARMLATDHRPIAREASPVDSGPSNDTPVSGAKFSERRNAPSALDGVRDTDRALLERMRAEDGKGQKHKVVSLPARLDDRLREQLREGSRLA